MCKTQVPCRTSVYFLFGGPESVFSQRHLSMVLVWPPWACFSFSCHLRELVWGDWVWSYSILLHCLLEMRRMKGLIQEYRQVISHTLQWVGTYLNQQPDVGAASLLLLGLDEKAQLPTPMLYVGWGRREQRSCLDKAHNLMYRSSEIMQALLTSSTFP